MRIIQSLFCVAPVSGSSYGLGCSWYGASRVAAGSPYGGADAHGREAVENSCGFGRTNQRSCTPP